jgi:transcriptional regulator GlxA family with amidase domain
VFGPIDALSLLSRSHSMKLYTIAATLDPVPTKQLTPKDCGAYQPPPTESPDFGTTILPTHTFSTVPALDVLLVPGGQGTRAHTPAISATIDFIRERFPSLKHLITVCTGSGLAARSGVLDGRRATTNKLAWDATTALRPQVDWVHRARWVHDGNIWTSSGISAGIDVTFAWMADVYGDEVANDIADRMEYTRVTDPDNDPFAKPRH